MNIIKQGENRGIFINVGAHIGKYALGLAQYFERTIAFEPTPKTFELLSKAAQEHPYTSRIELHDLCISDCKGNRFLSLNKFESQNAISLKLDMNAMSANSLIEIEASTLDAVLSPSDYSTVRLLLIDVQGAEQLVLFGAPKILGESNTTIIVEILEESSLLIRSNFLSQHGYGMEQLDKSNYLFSKQIQKPNG
jgi:FkbM family methyltransferase